MINLESVSGLPIEVDEETYQLNFGEGLPEIKPAVRKFSELKAVLMDPVALSGREDMYYMYRDVHFPKDEHVLRRDNIRYDITVMPPDMIGREFNKTAGHYHPPIKGSSIAYPEVYEIIHGHALLLIQKLDVDGSVRMVIALDAYAGDKIIYPPNYGHAMINVGADVLVASNMEADGFESLYEPIADKKGMAYYVVQGAAKLFDLVPNANYGQLPEARVLTAKDNPGAKMLPDKPLYIIGARQPEQLEFLNAPAKFAVELSEISS